MPDDYPILHSVFLGEDQNDVSIPPSQLGRTSSTNECTHSYTRNVPKLLVDLGITKFLPCKKLITKLPLDQGPAAAMMKNIQLLTKNSFL